MNASAVSRRVLPWSMGAAAALVSGLCFSPAAQAQVESFMLKRGGNVGPETQIKPTNCVTGPDGSVTCDTVIENPPSDTPAQPNFQPFKN
ncbi:MULTISPECIES: hypothetical protein [unclassified Cyanobium]|uniref:hypothetical protein n=1 Tax=unclassified Cyanobium TaxID=2627006 RepID=UPI0020CDA2E9|nr:MULTISPECIES: hypothetical protein [unclassified Cyanobium]MCP9797982.1 hypothetical protein [Cyanobium sp. Lug-B]MCP9932455.1 hypothetical protein [Cyanobium sp. Candia 9D4]